MRLILSVQEVEVKSVVVGDVIELRERGLYYVELHLCRKEDEPEKQRHKGQEEAELEGEFTHARTSRHDLQLKELKLFLLQRQVHKTLVCILNLHVLCMCEISTCRRMPKPVGLYVKPGL